jgi:acyl-CoA synthetase (AMP-forming)/AMP-acid ligase II
MLFTIAAISKLGAAPALVNTNLRHHTLLHCLSVVGAKLVICTPDHTMHLFEIFDEPAMPQHCLSLSLGSFPGLRLDPEIDSSGRISHIHPGDLALASTRNSFVPPTRKISDVSVLIYTSGTSGKPKAVSVKNNQFIIVATPLSLDANKPKKYYPMRTFACLPLFHGTCLFTGFFYSAGCGQTFCLGRKFSASSFSKSLIECRATRMLYVGELCRYLLKAPPSPYDRKHRVIVAAGNGLNKDVWTKFTTRFNIPEVREFYRSTEGIAKFDNFGSGAVMAGKVGFEGPIARRHNKLTYLVKYDTSTEEPWRDPVTGFCVPAKAGEAGEAIGRVLDFSTYSEYLNNPEANEKKLIRDVFAKGDVFQRTGDLLMRDSEGWVYFMDRSGDTYRWRGENVSAGEVRDHIAKLPEVQDAVVYGIRLPGYDGQAGAATITLYDHRSTAESNFAEELYARLRGSGLTAYQVPRLLRLLQR